MKAIFLLLLALPLSGWAAAESVSLAALLGRLQDSPELRAARASVSAAEAALRGARQPVALDVDLAAQTRSDPLASAPVANLGAGVTAYPFAYGAQGDTIRTRELELAQAQLNYRQARARLEVKAVRSAAEVELNRQALALAQQGAAAAGRLHELAQLRHARGLATVAEVRSAEAEQRRREDLVLTFSAHLALAETTLTALVGDARLAALPTLRTPEGTPFSLHASEIAVQLARVGASGAARPFYPVADVTYNLDLSEQSRLTASLSSRDLAPRLGYTYASDGWDDGVRLSVRLSATISPELFEDVTRLEQLQVAAEEALRGAQLDAAAQEGRLLNRLEETARNEQLATFVFENAERALREARQRQTLGVTTPLETQQAVLTWANAGASLWDSLYDVRRQRLTALLDLYDFYGLPPSELLP